MGQLHPTCTALAFEHLQDLREVQVAPTLDLNDHGAVLQAPRDGVVQVEFESKL
jgi:hypothetical protein